jgi:hypothetical protein
MTRTWIPLESNPEVLTEFAVKLGLDGSKWQFSDVFGLDPVGVQETRSMMLQAEFGTWHYEGICEKHACTPAGAA